MSKMYKMDTLSKRSSALTDLRGRQGRDPPLRGPNSLFFMQFLAKYQVSTPTLGVGDTLKKILDQALVCIFVLVFPLVLNYCLPFVYIFDFYERHEECNMFKT